MFKKFKNAPHLKVGIRGERLAVRLLREEGAEIICKNYRAKRGEIDIVAFYEGVLLFVEVKTRTAEKMTYISTPSDAVGFHKQKKIRLAAKEYLQKIKYKKVIYRFDVIEVLLSGRRLKSLVWKKDFFRSEPEYDNGFEFE